MHRSSLTPGTGAYQRARRGHRMLTVGYGGIVHQHARSPVPFRPDTPADELPAILTDALADVLILARSLGMDSSTIANVATQDASVLTPEYSGPWRCETCGTQDESDRYDGGDACTRCVHDAFAEGG